MSMNDVFLTPCLAAAADGHPSQEPLEHELAEEHELFSAIIIRPPKYLLLTI